MTGRENILTHKTMNFIILFVNFVEFFNKFSLIKNI